MQRSKTLPTVGFFALLVCATACARQAEPSQRPLPETETSGITYPSPDAALKALRSKPGVQVSEQAGWIVATDPEDGAVWTFTTAGHPAHPAAVKRKPVEHDGAVYIDMQIQCGGSKQACDDLVREFQALNESMAKAMEQNKAGAAKP
jgi:hypothetical protein